jgi:hypothetical protein
MGYGRWSIQQSHLYARYARALTIAIGPAVGDHHGGIAVKDGDNQLWRGQPHSWLSPRDPSLLTCEQTPHGGRPFFPVAPEADRVDTLARRRHRHATKRSQLGVGAGYIRKAGNHGNEELDELLCPSARVLRLQLDGGEVERRSDDDPSVV